MKTYPILYDFLIRIFSNLSFYLWSTEFVIKSNIYANLEVFSISNLIENKINNLNSYDIILLCLLF